MELRPYQSIHTLLLLDTLKRNQTAHDGSDTGVGKTYCAAWIAKALNVETLVICPLSVVPVWQRVLADAGVTATVMNYEMAWRRLGEVKPYGSGSFFKFSQQWPLTIYDEAHRTAGETSLNSKMLIASKRGYGKILTLSATAADSVMKLKALGFAWGIHHLSDYRPWLMMQGAREVPVIGRNGKPVIVKATGRPVTKLEIGKRENTAAMARLHEQVFGPGRIGSRMRIADIPDFPKTQIEVRLLNGQSKELERLSAEVLEFFHQRNTLAQFTDDERTKLIFWRQAAEVAKVPHLLDMAEDALETSKVAIFVNFNRTMDELLAGAKERGWTTGFIRGDDKDDRDGTIRRFQANQIDLLVSNIQAGGAGISLHDEVTQVPRTTLICPTWRAVDLKQVFGRAHRSGGGFSRQFLVCWDSGVEKRVASSAQTKLDRLDLLNDGELIGEAEPQLDLQAPSGNP